MSVTQTSYSIYMADDQRRSITDQGPFQNAHVAKSIEASALRSLFTDATNSQYIFKLLEKGYLAVLNDIDEDVLAGVSQARFIGLMGMGDHMDLGCPLELKTFMLSANEFTDIHPDLKFKMILPGNHDGGQYMGSFWSPKNLFGALNLGGEDFHLDTCGLEQPYCIEERIAAYDQMVRDDIDDSDLSYEDIVVNVVSRSRSFKLESEEKKIKHKNSDDVFETLWHQTQELERWDAIVHTNGDLIDIDKTDVRDWIHLQAIKKEEFALSDGSSVPIYEIGLDCQDFTDSPQWQASILGHVSDLQIAAVEAFIDNRLKNNPNAKFKIAMHYPIELLMRGSKKAVQKLLSREEIILVADAHRHLAQFDWDLRESVKIKKRKTPLARVSIPSLIDMPRQLVIEKMSFEELDETGQYQIKFNFEFVGLEPKDMAPKKENQEVYNKLNEFKLRLLDSRCAHFGHQAWHSDQEWCVDGEELAYEYSNEDQVIKNSPVDLQIIADSQESRFKQFWQIVRMLFDFGNQFMSRLTVHASIPQIQADFESYLVFLNCIKELLMAQDYWALANDLGKMILSMEKAKAEWESEYNSVKEVLGYKKRQVFNDLYTRANVNDSIYFINNNLPRDSYALNFAVIVGLEAAKEYYKMHHSGEDEHQPVGIEGAGVGYEF